MRGSRLGYDSLIVATGAQQSYFGHDEFQRWAPGMKSVDDALELRGRIFGAFEMAERETEPQARRRWLTFVVVGAGPTGVEMAGQIAELARRSLRHNYRSIDPSSARVVLLDAAPRALGPFPDSLAEKAVRDLRRIEAMTKVWAAGVQASGLGRLLAERTGAEVDRAGRVTVNPDCTLPGHPEIFVVGDLLALDDLPGVAEVAMQSGRHAARTVLRRLAGDATAGRFRYHDLGSMATVSRFRAIAAFNWLIAFVGRGRPQRVITTQQVFARRALTEHPETVRLPDTSSTPS